MNITPVNIFAKPNTGQGTGTGTSSSPFSNNNFLSNTKKGTLADNATFNVPNTQMGSSVFRNQATTNNTSNSIGQGIFKGYDPTPYGQRPITNSHQSNMSGVFGINQGQNQGSSTVGIFNTLTGQNQSPTSGSMFGRSAQTQPANSTEMTGIFNKNSPQNGIFNQTNNQGTTIWMGQSNSNGIFNQNQQKPPTQTSPFVQNIGNQPIQPNQGNQTQNPFNQNIFNPQGQNITPPQLPGIFPNNSQPFNPQLQPNTPLDANVQQYLMHFAQFLNNKNNMMQDPMPMNQVNQMPGMNHPAQNMGDYHMFLNQAINSDAVKKHATSKELFESAESWANQVMPPPNYRLFSEQARQKQIEKLFDAKMLPYPFEMSHKDLPPVEPTIEMIESMNDEYSCRIILSELRMRLKKTFDQSIKAIPSETSSSDFSNKKIKGIPYFHQLQIMWRQLTNVESKIKQLQKNQTMLTTATKAFNIKTIEKCQLVKTSFVQIDKNNKMVREIDEELNRLSEYMDRDINPLFKAYLDEKAYPFDDPDIFVLETAVRTLNKLQNLETALDDQLSLITPQTQDSSPNDFLINLCQYYQHLANQIYQVDSKIKEYVSISARKQNYHNPSDLLSKFEEKSKEAYDKKFQVYDKIKEIEQIIKDRDPFAITQLQKDKKESNNEPTVQAKSNIFMKMTESSSYDPSKANIERHVQPPQ